MAPYPETLDLNKVNFRGPIGPWENIPKCPSDSGIDGKVNDSPELNSEFGGSDTLESPGGVPLNQRLYSEDRQKYKRKSGSIYGEPKTFKTPSTSRPGLPVVKNKYTSAEPFVEAARQSASKGTKQDENTSPQESMTMSLTNSSSNNGHNVPSGNTPQWIDAQVKYPSSACLFVANLPRDEEDDVLHAELHRILKQYNVIQVKVRRDGRQMPFAFCQFKYTSDADRASERCEGLIILGRPCRMEKANAHSKFTVHKRSGGYIRSHEAQNLMRALGEIERTYRLSPQTQQELCLPSSWVVEYKHYNSTRDPVRYFAENSRFVVRAYEPRAAANDVAAERRRAQEQQRLLERVERDGRSLFFGNIPPTLSQENFRELVNLNNSVVDVQVIRRPMADGSCHCFAFVEFMGVPAADRAWDVFDRATIHGHTFNVKRKQTPGLTPLRITAGPQSTPSGSSGRQTSQMNSSNHHSSSGLSRYTSPMGSANTPSGRTRHQARERLPGTGYASTQGCSSRGQGHMNQSMALPPPVQPAFIPGPHGVMTPYYGTAQDANQCYGGAVMHQYGQVEQYNTYTPAEPPTYNYESQMSQDLYNTVDPFIASGHGPTNYAAQGAHANQLYHGYYHGSTQAAGHYRDGDPGPSSGNRPATTASPEKKSPPPEALKSVWEESSPSASSDEGRDGDEEEGTSAPCDDVDTLSEDGSESNKPRDKGKQRAG